MILCEGKTEERYAKQMKSSLLPRSKQRSVAVEITKAKKSDPLNMCHEALVRTRKAKREKNEYDAVWLFFDHDNRPNLEDVFELLSKHDLNFAYTAICMEHWYILHFEECGRAFPDGSEAVKYLRRKHWKDYRKAKKNDFKILDSGLQSARKRASKLNKAQKDKMIHNRNPYFTIPDLIAYFERLAKE